MGRWISIRCALDGGPGAERLELSTPELKFPTDWSPDDRVVLFNSLAAEGGVDIAALRLDGTRRPFDVVKTPANEQHAQFSPDGRWIAYQSDKTGGFEIYVRPFPGPGADVRVSSNGGAQPRWNPRGQELFYVAADDRLMAVPMVERSGMPEPGPPTSLFVTTVGSTAPNTNRQQYSVSPDGRGFLMNSLVDSPGASPVTVLLNWMPPRCRRQKVRDFARRRDEDTAVRLSRRAAVPVRGASGRRVRSTIKGNADDEPPEGDGLSGCDRAGDRCRHRPGGDTGARRGHRGSARPLSSRSSCGPRPS